MSRFLFSKTNAASLKYLFSPDAKLAPFKSTLSVSTTTLSEFKPYNVAVLSPPEGI